jgi:hypothetical protein
MLFYYPNRPTLLPPDPDSPLNPKPNFINDLEKSGKYIAEQKWNGDNILIYTDNMEFWNRHKSKHRYGPPSQMIDELKKFPKGCILNGELINYRTKEIKNLLIIHTILAWKHKLLFGKTWGDARLILENQEYGEHIILSPVWRKGFWNLFEKADGKIIEGIVLKNPSGKIIFSTTPLKDVSYMYKIRKPCKKYSF